MQLEVDYIIYHVQVWLPCSSSIRSSGFGLKRICETILEEVEERKA